MGMYTEIFVKVSLKENCPKEVIELLQYMMGDSEEQPSELPQHKFFTTNRWNFMLRCSSYYHQPKRTGEMFWDEIGNQWYICNRSDFKDYGNESELFFDWIKPYVESYGKKLIGYTLYEEDVEPVLYYTDEDTE